MSDNNTMKYKIEVDASQATKNIEKFQKNLKAAFDGKGIKPGLNSMNKEMNSSINKMSKDMSNMAKGMTKQMDKATSGMTTGLKNQLKRMSKLSSTAMNTGKVLGKAVLKGMQMALTGVAAIGKVLFKALSALSGSFLSIGKMFGTAISNGIRMCTGLMRTAGKFLTSAISTGIKMGYGVVKFAARGLVNTISVSLQGAYKVASNVAGKITGVISKAINQKGKIDLQANLGNSKTKAYDSMSGNVFMNSLNNMLSGIKATLPKQIGSIFESITLSVANSFTKLGNTILLVSQSFTFFKSYGPKILSMISSVISTIKPYIQSAMNVVGAYMKLQMGTTFAPLKAVLAELVAMCREAGESLIATAKNFARSLGSSVGTLMTVWKGLEKSVSIVKGAFNGVKEKVASFSNSIAGLGSKIKSVGDSIKNGIGAAIEKFKTTMPQTTILLTESCKSVASILKTAMENVTKVFKGTLSKTIDAVKPWVSALGKVIESVAIILNPLIQPLRKFANTIIGLSGDFLKEFINGVINFAKKLGISADALGDFAQTVAEHIAKYTKKLGEAINKVSDWLQNAPKPVKLAAGGLATGAGILGAKKGVDHLRETGARILESKTSPEAKLSRAADKLKKAADALLEAAGKSPTDKIKNGIERAKSITDKTSKGKSIVDHVKETADIISMAKDSKKATEHIKDFVKQTEKMKKAGEAASKGAKAMDAAAKGARVANAARTGSKLAKGAKAAQGGFSLAKAGKGIMSAATGNPVGTAIFLAEAGVGAYKAGKFIKGKMDEKKARKAEEEAQRQTYTNMRPSNKQTVNMSPIEKEIQDVANKIESAYNKVGTAKALKSVETPYTDKWKQRDRELTSAQNDFEALKKYKELLQNQQKLNDIKASRNAYSNGRYITEDKIRKGKEELLNMNVDLDKLGIDIGQSVSKEVAKEVAKEIEQGVQEATKKAKISSATKKYRFTDDVGSPTDNVKTDVAETVKEIGKLKETADSISVNIIDKNEKKDLNDYCKRLDEYKKKLNEMDADGKEVDLKINTHGVLKDIENLQSKLMNSTDNIVGDDFLKEFDKITDSIKTSMSAQETFNDKLADTVVTMDSLDDSVENFSSGIKEELDSAGSAFDKIAEEAKSFTDNIQQRLTTALSTKVPQEQVQELRNEFDKAAKDFQDMFKVKGGSGSLKKDLGSLMEKISKYSDMLAKIKNPLLTIRTEKVKQSFKELTENAKATKAAFDKFKTTSKIDSAIQESGSGFNMLERMESKVIKLKDGFGLLKSAMKTAFSYNKFNNDSKSLGDTEKDLQKLKDTVTKMKDKIKGAFKSMFDGAKNVTKTGWQKIVSMFKKGSSDCQKPVDRLKGVMGKLAGAFGLYQIGSIMKDATKSAIQYEASLATIQRTLGGASKGLIDFANGNAVAFGLSKEQVMSYGNIYSLLVSNFETDATKAAKTTEKLLQAAGTIAAGTGYSVESVLENLRSGINGSSEAVDQLGLNLKVANMAAKAGVKDWNKLTTEQQQAIIVQEILNQTASKYGGIVDTAASRQAMFTAQLANTKMALGNLGATIWTAIMPALTSILKYLEIVFNYATRVISTLLKMFGIQVGFGGGSATNNVPAVKPQAQQTTKPVVDSSSTEDATDKNDKLSDSYGKVGDSAKKSAKDVKDSAKTMKGSLAGIDEINVLSFDKGDSDSEDPEDTFTMPDYDDVEFEVPESFVDGITEIPEMIIEGVEPIFEGIQKFFEELFDPLMKAWESMSPRLLKAIKAFCQAAKDAFKALGELLGSIWDNGGKELLQHLAEIALAAATVAFEIGTRMLQAFKRLCEYLDPTVNKVTQGMIDALNEAAVATRDFILGITEHFNSLMDNGLEDFILNFADTFNKGITACAKIWTEFMYCLDELLDHLDPINNAFTQDLLDNMNSAIIAVGDTFLAFAELVKDFRRNGGQEFINAMADMVLAVVNLGVRMTEISANALTGLFEHLDPSQNEIARNCIDSFTLFAEQIRDALGTIGDSIERFMSSGGQNVVNNLADIILLIADFAATLTGDIIDTIASFFDSWAGHMVIDLTAAALELLTKALKGLLEILNGPLAPLIEGLVAGFGALVVAQKVVTFFGPLVTLFQKLAASGGIMEVLVGLFDKLRVAFPLLTSPVGLTVAAIAALAVGMVALYNKCEPFRELVDKIIEGFKGFTEAVEKHMLPIIERVKNIFGNVIDIIVGIFEGDGEKVGTAVRNLVENIVMLIGELSVAFVEVGWNLIKGLVQGIWECVKAIPKLLAGVGEFIIDFFKGLFGIHSPSTVFAEIGEFMIQGLVEGLSDISSVIKELGSMATNIITEAGTKLKEAGSKCVEKIKDGITTAAKTLKEKGKDIIDGIQQGCKNNWDKLKETGKTLGSKIKDGFCNILGINSPSRVMKDQGKYIVDGVKQGIESNQSAAASIARALGLSIDTNTLQGMSKLTANVSSAISKMSTNSSSAMKKAVTGMVNAFDGIGNKISTKFKTVETSISKVSTNVKTTMTNMVNKLKNAFNFTWKLPNLKLPKLEITMATHSLGFKYPKFSMKWLRNGGLVNSPSILGGASMVGAGEAGKEVVIPLENSTFAKTFADTVGNMMLDIMKEQTAAMIKANNSAGQSGGKQDVVLKINERELGRASIDAINNYQRKVGKTLLRV